jgi:hypothetical protein
MKRQSPSRQKPSLQFFTGSEDSGKLRCSNTGTGSVSFPKRPCYPNACRSCRMTTTAASVYRPEFRCRSVKMSTTNATTAVALALPIVGRIAQMREQSVKGRRREPAGSSLKGQIRRSSPPDCPENDLPCAFSRFDVHPTARVHFVLLCHVKQRSRQVVKHILLVALARGAMPHSRAAVEFNASYLHRSPLFYDAACNSPLVRMNASNATD